MRPLTYHQEPDWKIKLREKAEILLALRQATAAKREEQRREWAQTQAPAIKDVSVGK